mmetsp:Transcript_125517/g.287560  ORF Transcript_125517/g.287560 Transcript_125517/m.287560 type:complete len:94 (-) Transcript_125517:357-638(-)
MLGSQQARQHHVTKPLIHGKHADHLPSLPLARQGQPRLIPAMGAMACYPVATQALVAPRSRQSDLRVQAPPPQARGWRGSAGWRCRATVEEWS